MFKVTTEPLSVQQINDLVKRPTDGAMMAEKKLAEIGAEVQQKFAIGAIAMVHRIGRLEIGESSIVIAVAAPHRHAAFEACAYAMDRVKAEVPVWKKEFFADGTDHWVNQN